MAEQSKSIALYLTNESSDKEYHLELAPSVADPSRWDFTVRYGKRGKPLRSMVKNEKSGPLPYAEADALYEKTLKGQLREGYTPDQGGAAYQATSLEARLTGLVPQLANAVRLEQEADIEAMLADDAWVLEQKHNGERLMIRKGPEGVVGSNKQGLRVAIPLSIEAAVLALPCGACVLDGEWLGERFAGFDLLELDGQDLRPSPQKSRKQALDALVAKAPGDAWVENPTASGEPAKRAMLAELRAKKAEGGMFKRADAAWAAGRPNSGGPQIKLKFVESATLIVGEIKGTKRSVPISGLDAEGALVALGNVTIPSNHAIPAEGDLVEVQYLYAHEGGALHQPVYLGPRSDIAREECLLTQLKYEAKATPARRPKI